MAREDVIKFLDEDITTAELTRSGFSRKIVLQTWDYYRSELGERMEQLYRKALSTKLSGNQNGSRPLMTTIPEMELKSCVEKGLSIDMMAKKFGTTWHLVQRNLQALSLTASPWSSSQLHDLTQDQLEKLSVFNPHVVEAWKTRGLNREKFVLEMYRCFLSAATTLHWIRDLGSNAYQSSWRKGQRKIPSICWSINQHEMILALALEDSHIPYARQVNISNRMVADFVIIGTNVVVEVDGPYHVKEEDMKMDNQMRRLGLKVLRFSLNEMKSNIQLVMEKILKSTQLPRSVQLGFDQSGTFKLTRITRTQPTVS
jgi:very-short-patch-repair endonuclease